MQEMSNNKYNSNGKTGRPNYDADIRKTAATLKGHIKKHMSLLCESMDEIHAAMDKDIPMLGKTSRAAVLIAGLIENYYTCSETIFVRISQFFENNLSPDKWHQDLLERMTLELDDLAETFS